MTNYAELLTTEFVQQMYVSVASLDVVKTYSGPCSSRVLAYATSTIAKEQVTKQNFHLKIIFNALCFS